MNRNQTKSANATISAIKQSVPETTVSSLVETMHYLISDMWNYIPVLSGTYYNLTGIDNSSFGSIGESTKPNPGLIGELESAVERMKVLTSVLAGHSEVLRDKIGQMNYE